MAITVDPYFVEAERLAAARSGDADWVKRARRDALGRFEALGFPTTRDEEWRFTNVAPIAHARFTIPADGGSSLRSADIAAFEWPGERAATLVFVNGRCVEPASTVRGLPKGVRVESLAQALGRRDTGGEAYLTRLAAAERHAFTALNTAFVADGAFIHVPDSTVVEAPIHVLFLSAGGAQPTMTHPRVLVVLGANSRAAVVETYGAVHAERYLTNTVTEVVVGESATLDHCKIQHEHPSSFHIGAMYLRAAKDASLACHSASFGGALARNEVSAVLDGQGARCTLNGLYLGDGTRLVDNHTTIDHAQPHCGSREVYKGVLADRSRAVFNGKVIVRPDAQKTDAKQTNKALLLSEDAQINTKPQLEIFANDVKCTHGAAVGQIDDEAVFYLRARGLGEQEAHHMLIRAFAADVLNQIPIGPLRTRLDEDLMRRLPGGRP
jgi:Fe-S cluster assembly protein SufD